MKRKFWLDVTHEGGIDFSITFRAADLSAAMGEVGGLIDRGIIVDGDRVIVRYGANGNQSYIVSGTKLVLNLGV